MKLDLFIILKHIINVALIYITLRFLLYKPVVKFMNDRSARIAKSIEDAKHTNEEALKIKGQYDSLIAGSKNEIEQMYDDAEKKANGQADQIIADAQKQAAEIIRASRETALQEREKIMAKMQSEIVDMAIEIASKVLTREVTIEDNKAIVDKFFKKAE